MYTHTHRHTQAIFTTCLKKTCIHSCKIITCIPKPKINNLGHITTLVINDDQTCNFNGSSANLLVFTCIQHHPTYCQYTLFSAKKT
uniref:Uncharacterized protein n=1 Tax=Anguilla anguilla TaxID=7936 RepID=A0A0E9X354_ANGAN